MRAGRGQTETALVVHQHLKALGQEIDQRARGCDRGSRAVEHKQAWTNASHLVVDVKIAYRERARAVNHAIALSAPSQLGRQTR
jgi:hypothetical protein